MAMLMLLRMSASIRCLLPCTTRLTSPAAGSTPVVSAPWAFGLPAAMGVKFALPDAEVVCVTGDGSIQMNIQELSTALQYDIPVKIINLNNRFLGMVKQWQDMIYQGRHSHSYMDSVPDFAAIAEAYGHVGVRISDPNKLEEELEKALALKDRLVFIDISVDETEHVYPMLIRGGSMSEMWLSKTERT